MMRSLRYQLWLMMVMKMRKMQSYFVFNVIRVIKINVSGGTGSWQESSLVKSGCCLFINRCNYNGTSWTNICTTAVANIMELVWKVYTLNNVSENYGRKVNWDIYLCTSIASYMMYLVKQINVNIFAPLFFSLVKGGDPIFCAFEDLWTSIQNCLTTFRKCDNDR